MTIQDDKEMKPNSSFLVHAGVILQIPLSLYVYKQNQPDTCIDHWHKLMNLKRRAPCFCHCKFIDQTLSGKLCDCKTIRQILFSLCIAPLLLDEPAGTLDCWRSNTFHVVNNNNVTFSFDNVQTMRILWKCIDPLFWSFCVCVSLPHTASRPTERLTLTAFK